MFQGLRAGAPFYVLDKNVPQYEVYEVASVTPARPQLNTTFQAGSWPTQPRMVVDVHAKKDKQIITFKELPSDYTIADFGDDGVVVSESKEAILSEIENLCNSSKRALEDMPRHEGIVEKCNAMILALTPKSRQDVERDEEISSLKKELAEMKSMLAQALKPARTKKEE